MFTDIYKSLKQGFQKSWFKLFFKNTALASLLSQTEAPSAWDFFRTYFSSWWWTRLWFRSCIQTDELKGFDYLLYCLQSLKKNKVFNEDNCNTVAAHADSANWADALFDLQKAGILTQDNFDLVATRSSPCYLAKAFRIFQQARLLTEENRDLLAAQPESLFSFSVVSLSYLQRAGLLTEENRDLIFAQPYPTFWSGALFALKKAGILTQANRALVLDHVDHLGLADALCNLNYAGILNQDSFATLIVPNHVTLVSERARELIWERIPEGFLTQAIFQRLLTAAEHANPMAELERVRDQILVGHLGVGHAAAFNPGQSTHTASVHRSVSTSALKLMQSYGPGLVLEDKIQEIRDCINGLSDTPKHQAAKTCIARITADDYTFTDTSGVSTRQLLALAYTAIHDESKRSGTLEDALALFVEGLYEIQRGYNLNDRGQNQGGDDAFICTAGTFNKLMEKLNGIHQDVSVYYITHEVALFKLPRLVAAHAHAYLQSLVAETADDYCRLKELLEAFKTDGSLEPIWEQIKAGVQIELWDEFKEAYGDNPNHHQFLVLMDYGPQVNPPDLSAFEAALLASPGHQAFLFLEEQMRLSLDAQGLIQRLAHQSFWSNRNASAEVREEFDQQYGLILRP